MNIYSYLDHTKKTLTESIVFTCEAGDILEADAIATKAGHNPMKLRCSIGITLVFFRGCTSYKLWNEEVIKVEAKVAEDGTVTPAKYHLNLPGWHYKNDETVTSIYPNKLEAIWKNEGLGAGNIFWQTPHGTSSVRSWPASGEIDDLLQKVALWKKYKYGAPKQQLAPAVPNLVMSHDFLKFLAAA